MIRETLMIRKTVHKIGKKLEQLTKRDISMTRAFDILSKKAGNIEEIVVIEVMREVYQELLEGELSILTYAVPKTRAARTPLMALSR